MDWEKIVYDQACHKIKYTKGRIERAKEQKQSKMIITFFEKELADAIKQRDFAKEESIKLENWWKNHFSKKNSIPYEIRGNSVIFRKSVHTGKKVTKEKIQVLQTEPCIYFKYFDKNGKEYVEEYFQSDLNHNRINYMREFCLILQNWDYQGKINYYGSSQFIPTQFDAFKLFFRALKGKTVLPKELNSERKFNAKLSKYL